MTEDIRAEGNVWFAKMEEITVHIQKCIDDGSWTPREISCLITMHRFLAEGCRVT